MYKGTFKHFYTGSGGISSLNLNPINTESNVPKTSRSLGQFLVQDGQLDFKRESLARDFPLILEEKTRTKKTSFSSINIQNDKIVKKRIALVDLTNVEKRARLISASNWMNYVDWMGFQIARDKSANGVLYFKNRDVVRMAGSILFVRRQGNVHVLLNKEGLNSAEKSKMEKGLKQVKKIFSRDNFFRDLSMRSRVLSVDALNNADEIWAFQVRKGIISISDILDTGYQSGKVGIFTSYLAGLLNQ